MTPNDANLPDGLSAIRLRKLVHDIRSPLTALKVLSQTANTLPDDSKELLVQAVQRLSNIVQELSKPADSNAAGSNAAKG